MAFVRPITRLKAQSSSVAGTSQRTVAGTGVAVSQDAVVAGFSARVVDGSGILTSGPASAAGTGFGGLTIDTIPNITLAVGETHDMDQYINDPLSQVVDTSVTGLLGYASYSDATRLLTGVSEGSETGLQLEVEVGSALYSSSFEYTEECSLDGDSGYPVCDATNKNGDALDWVLSSNGGLEATRAVSAASRTGTGYGLRQSIYDGTNQQGGVAFLRFYEISGADLRQPELWIRWYERWEAGFTWSGGNPGYSKQMYLFTTNPVTLGSDATYPGTVEVILDWAAVNGNTFVIAKQGTSTQNTANAGPTGFAWSDIHGNPSDGNWHQIECYIKMDTDQTDGIGRCWIDGTLCIDRTDLDYSNGNTQDRLGWTHIRLPSNQTTVANGASSPMYLDIDDIEIWNTTPPNTDGSGNPRIG